MTIQFITFLEQLAVALSFTTIIMMGVFFLGLTAMELAFPLTYTQELPSMEGMLTEFDVQVDIDALIEASEKMIIVMERRLLVKKIKAEVLSEQKDSFWPEVVEEVAANNSYYLNIEEWAQAAFA